MRKQCGVCGQKSVPWWRVVAGSSRKRCDSCGENNEVVFSPRRISIQLAGFFAYFYVFALSRGTSLEWLWFPLMLVLGVFIWALALSAPLRPEVKHISRMKLRELALAMMIFLAVLLACCIGITLGRISQTLHVSQLGVAPAISKR